MAKNIHNINIGSRGSKLALWQANFLTAQLAELGLESSIQVIKTKGDRIQHLSFDKIEGKGFFTKEIEDFLLRGDVDLAVHSLKDMPTSQPEGLALTALSYRENPADWLLIRKEKTTDGQLFQLPQGAIVGTSSARRKAQILDFRPDVEIKDIRGNVPTRINKLREGQYDAILLAAAGIIRLELEQTLSDLSIIKMNPREFVPAPGQGVLAYQTLASDKPLRRQLKAIHHADIAACTNVERKVLKLMGGGCHMPLGVYCELDANRHFHVWAAKAETWDGALKRVQLSSSTSHQLAERIVEMLK